MPPDTSDVFTAIDRRRDEFLDDLQQYLRIPSISTDPAYKNDIARCADVRARAARGRRPLRAPDRERRPPAGLRRVAGRAGQADAPLLRPLRRAAARPARALAPPAVRADARGQRAGGARRHRRQGPVARAHRRRGGDARSARQPAGQRQVPDRGRGGVGRPRHRELRARRRAAASSPATRWWCRTRRCSAPAGRRCSTRCAASPTSRSRWWGRTSTCTRAPSAAWCRTRCTRCR